MSDIIIMDINSIDDLIDYLEQKFLYVSEKKEDYDCMSTGWNVFFCQETILEDILEKLKELKSKMDRK